MRYIYVLGGTIVNIVEHPEPPPEQENGTLIILEEPQSSKAVGEIYDPTPDLQERSVTKIDAVVLKELFRLTNAVRALQIPPQTALTALQYRAFLKTLL